MIEALNTSLFLLVNASEHSDAFLLFIAKLLAEYIIWLIPLFLVFAWLRRGVPVRRYLLEATLSAFMGLLINQGIGLVWPHPRPFMIGLGHTFIQHVADSSFPSDHLTLLWSVSFSFLLHRQLRPVGVVLSILGLPMAWARIYLGVHFPLDMAGALLVSGISTGTSRYLKNCLVEPILRTVLPVYRFISKPFIQRGWIVD